MHQLQAKDYDRWLDELKMLVKSARIGSSGFVGARPSDSGRPVITCATFAREPVVLGEWLRPGQNVDLINSISPAMREVDDTAMQHARVIIDSELAKVESGDVKIPLDNGAISESDIVATLTQLCRGENAGRTSNDEITLFKGVGLAAAVLSMRLTDAC